MHMKIIPHESSELYTREQAHSRKFKKVQMTIRVPPDLRERMERLALNSRRSVANFIELCLSESVQKFESHEDSGKEN
jgi:predicted HicB family RNase H-like nuclease